MIRVLLPSTLQSSAGHELAFTQPIANMRELVDAVDRQVPGFRDQVDDAAFNFAVNDEMLLYRATDRELKDGDVVEVIPTIAGG